MLDLAPLSLLLVLLFGAFVIALAWPRPARANTEFVNDPADTSGPLDIKEAVEGHDGPGVLTARLKTWEPFPGRSLSGPNVISFAFYDQGYPFRWVYVHRRGPHLVAVVEKDDGEVLGVEPVSRPEQANPRSPHTHGARRPASRLSLGGSDSLPQRRCMFAHLHRRRAEFAPVREDGRLDRPPEASDLTAPMIRLLDFPDPSTRRSASLRYQVRFAVRERAARG